MEPKEVAEQRATGSISLRDYCSYVTAGGNVFSIAVLLLMCIFLQMLILFGDVWISYWYGGLNVINYLGSRDPTA